MDGLCQVCDGQLPEAIAELTSDVQTIIGKDAPKARLPRGRLSFVLIEMLQALSVQQFRRFKPWRYVRWSDPLRTPSFSCEKEKSSVLLDLAKPSLARCFSLFSRSLVRWTSPGEAWFFLGVPEGGRGKGNEALL